MAARPSALESLKARLSKRRTAKRAPDKSNDGDKTKRPTLEADSTTNDRSTSSATVAHSSTSVDAGKQEATNHVAVPPKTGKTSNQTSTDDELASLLDYVSYQEEVHQEENSALVELLATPSVMEQAISDRFKSTHGSIREFCEHNTNEQCMQARHSRQRCGLMHFRRVVSSITDPTLGDCSYLNDCRNPGTCKFMHYEVDPEDDDRIRQEQQRAALQPRGQKTIVKTELDMKDLAIYPGQWIQCDVRNLDMAVLGKFSVIMADPPWHIHMDLPYGTMEDHEMRSLPIPQLQDDGYIFLWVTGRAMELSRELLQVWGYNRVDELIWVKTNQLQKLIRTGRTGHWMNHAKEHCVIGVKGNPQAYNRGLDCDVLVAEVRQTSQKPDEVYGLIERLAPGTRKLELFGRQHNVQPNWVTLGNQLDGIRLTDPALIDRFKRAYPYPQHETQIKLLTGKFSDELAADMARLKQAQASAQAVRERRR
eukprot:m.203219 g.203219  ORF g.203219 m.203219 type:complete len:480 (+) comp17070_c1_seq3:125-1564(+)